MQVEVLREIFEEIMVEIRHTLSARLSRLSVFLVTPPCTTWQYLQTFIHLVLPGHLRPRINSLAFNVGIIPPCSSAGRAKPGIFVLPKPRSGLKLPVVDQRRPRALRSRRCDTYTAWLFLNDLTLGKTAIESPIEYPPQLFEMSFYIHIVRRRNL